MDMKLLPNQLTDLEVPLDFEQLFSLSAVAVNDYGWTEVPSPKDGLRLWRQDDSPTTVLMRTRFELPMTPSDAVNLFRPEVFFNEARKTFDHEVQDCGMSQLLAPGDALGFILLNKDVVTPEMLKSVALLGTTGCINAMREDDVDYGMHVLQQMRLSVRRDEPQLGMFSVARAPQNPKTLKVLWEWGVSKASVGVFEGSGDNSKTIVTEVLRYDRRAVLTTEVLANAPRMLTFVQQMEEKLSGYRNSDAFYQLTIGDESYVVLTLRKCERGPPLLPCCELVHPNSGLTAEWSQVEKYELPMYLRSFLDLAGLRDVAVHSCIDGRGLRPYQAVVKKCSWASAWPVLIDHWGIMQSMYRYQFGGANAPQLRTSIEPRFQDLRRPTPPPGLEVEFAIHRTFVHVSGTDLESVVQTKDAKSFLGNPSGKAAHDDTSDTVCPRGVAFPRGRAASESEAGGCAQS